MTDQITISKQLYDTFNDNTTMLECLRTEGVHEWSGYRTAMERYHAWLKIRTHDSSVVTPMAEIDPVIQAMREAGWTDDMLREAGMLGE